MAVALALGSGPVCWQTVGGQYAGLLIFGLTGFLVAHKANRPILAGLCLTLIALKPHLFLPLAVGLLIDGFRSGFGRRVLLGGFIGLAMAATWAGATNPAIWEWYSAAAQGAGPGGRFYPKLSEWVNPTIGSHLRFALPGHPAWVQALPTILCAVLFGRYWWKQGSPDRWPAVMHWVVPLALVTAPYGAWASDLTLLLVPVIWIAVRIDAIGWPLRVWPALAGYASVNAVIFLMTAGRYDPSAYVWVTPAVSLLMLWAYREMRDRPTAVAAESPVPTRAAVTQPAS